MSRRTEPELPTARLRLRMPVPGDVDVVWRIHQDPAAVAHNPSDALADRAAAEDLLRRWQARWQRDGAGYRMVARRTDPTVLGFCGVKPMLLADAPVLNLFYRLDPAWGPGVATEALTAVLGSVTRIRPDQRLVARIRPGNAASARVAPKAGLIRAADLNAEAKTAPTTSGYGHPTRAPDRPNSLREIPTRPAAWSDIDAAQRSRPRRGLETSLRSRCGEHPLDDDRSGLLRSDRVGRLLRRPAG